MIRRVLLLLLTLAVAGPLWASTPASAARVALQDLEKLPPDHQINVRYLTVYAVPEKDREAFAKVLNFTVNSLSREADLVAPGRVAPDLYRIDLRDYGWKREVYEKLADADVYFHAKLQFVAVPAVFAVGDTVQTIHACSAFRADAPASVRGQLPAGSAFTVLQVQGSKLLTDSSGGRIWVNAADVRRTASGGKRTTAAAPWLPADTMTRLIALTQSQAPILRADWLFAQVIRQVDRKNKETGAGYYDLLGIKEEKDIEFLAGLDRKTARRLRRELAAIIAESGVALNNRQIFAIQDGYWESHDADKSEDESNAIRQLDGDFKFQAKEVYFRLPNGLWGLAAVGAADGKLQATVPDNIASDRTSTSNDARVHPALGCVRCHTSGLQPIDDWARAFYRNPPGDAKLTSPDYEKYKRLKQLYLGPLEDRYEDDQRFYARVLMRLTGWTPAEAAKAVAKAWQTYADTSVSGTQFAAELGVSEEEMIAAFKAYAAADPLRFLDPVLLGYVKRPAFVARREFVEEAFPLAQQALLAARKEKKQP